ncbi:hypothetical protein [Burkholderia vietnamiensis]|uniref:hypothetical protein n=1 Tax=Burkholderia vietnamiensis TaxID=60552 RepID=UPI00158D19B6|nr:hypothetical protein [Burkholderia vietnamiensis]MCA8145419.1 hypothetical protein [Burkholderia vietnamiensis]
MQQHLENAIDAYNCARIALKSVGDAFARIGTPDACSRHQLEQLVVCSQQAYQEFLDLYPVQRGRDLARPNFMSVTP